MKRRDALLFALTFCLQTTLFSQIKRAFVDDQAEATTVVVKEDQADDLSILMSQFDMSKMSMGEEVRITTGDWRLEEKPAPRDEEVLASLDQPMTDFTTNEQVEVEDHLELPDMQAPAPSSTRQTSSPRKVDASRKRQKVKFRRPFEWFKRTKYRNSKCPTF